MSGLSLDMSELSQICLAWGLDMSGQHKFCAAEK
jgi:hypothetical protein